MSTARLALAVVTACTLVFILAPAVQAAPAIPPADTTTVPLDESNQGGFVDPVAGASPHGGYSTTSNKCKVCHAVHGASATGEKLMRTTNVYYIDPADWTNQDPWEDNTSTSCVFCHVGGPYAITQVYGANPELYWMESTQLDYIGNHASSHAMGMGTRQYQGCPSCHSVHGANTWDPDTSDADPATSILRNDPGPSLPVPVTNMDEYCRDCHDMSGQNGAIAAPSACGNGCHRAWLYTGTEHVRAVGLVTESPLRDGQSHIMTTTLTNAAGDARALAGTPDCRSCHMGGNGTYSNSFPHLTSGSDFLQDDYVLTTHLDKVCLSCHDDGVADGTFGVGDSY
ncbi:MAG: hypothetical protein ACYC6T_12370 [Thermoleophilia bacterium]